MNTVARRLALALILPALVAGPLLAACQVSGCPEALAQAPEPTAGPDDRGIWRGGSQPFQVEIDRATLRAGGLSAEVAIRCPGACPQLVVLELWPQAPQDRVNQPCEDGYTNRVATWRPKAGETSTKLEVPTMWPACIQGPPASLTISWGAEGQDGTGAWIKGHAGWLTCGFFTGSPPPSWRFGHCPP